MPRGLWFLAGSSVDGVFTVAGGEDDDNKRSEVSVLFCLLEARCHLHWLVFTFCVDDVDLY